MSLVLEAVSAAMLMMRGWLGHMAVTLAALALVACAPQVMLQREPVSDLPDDGELYTLIYFVGQGSHDKRRAVVLDLVGDDVSFALAVRDLDYEILQEVSMEEALYETEFFFRYEGAEGNIKSAIRDLQGTLLGYEFKPLYNPDKYGRPDVTEVFYKMKSPTLVEVGVRFVD